MNKFLTCFLIVLTFSCIEKKKEPESVSKSGIKVEKKEVISLNIDSTELKAEPIVETKNSDTLFIDPNDFPYSNLKEFDLRNWYVGKMDKELKSPTKEKLVNYLQNERLNLEDVYPKNWKYFSIQKNEESEKIITMIEGDESCCSDLHYLVYNGQNELLSDNVVAGTGGDGMWTYDQYGSFVNDSTYILTRTDWEEVELANGETEIQIDSIITNYRFHKNKPFRKLTERKFQRVEKQ